MSAADDHGARWMTLMRSGRWEEAWRLSDAALAARGGRRDWTQPRHLQPVWDGTPLAGRSVLVRCYHGLGDTIQFARLLAPLQRIAAKVVLWAQPSLLPLLATLRPTPCLLPLHDGTPDIACDVDIEIMELAHALRITPDALPGTPPYLHPPPPTPPRSHRLEVGLVWRAGDWDARRSVPLDLLRPLAGIPGIALRILQRGPGLAERSADFGSDIGTDDIMATATRMRGLDLIISVDSMPAHLAGALGVPVWLLLARPADWRWMEGRADAPWYPSMRLFRQAHGGVWQTPVAHLLKEVSALRHRPAQSAPRSPTTSPAG